MKRLIPFLLLSVLLTERGYSSPKAEFYSEGAYWSGTSAVSNSIFARAFADLNKALQPFLQMGAEQNFGDQENGNFYLSPGIHWRKDFLKVYGEHRFHQNNNENLTSHEWRALLMLGNTLDFPLRFSAAFIPFWEPYFELLLSSNENNNILFQALSRLGLRYQISSRTSTDFFVEPYLSYLQNKLGDSDQFQVRPSLRARTCFGSFCMSFSAARLVPVGNDIDQGFRFLATLGGMI